jgi:hypothetical protein
MSPFLDVAMVNDMNQILTHFWVNTQYSIELNADHNYYCYILFIKESKDCLEYIQ